MPLRFLQRRPLLSLIAVTLLIRTAALWALGTHFDQDPDAYAVLATGLREHGVLGFVNPGQPVRPTALRPPLYPCLLAPLVSNGRLLASGVAVLHVLLGVATVLCVERLGALWQLGRWRWLAAVLVACDPLLLHQSTLVMSETLATWMAAACLLALSQLGSDRNSALTETEEATEASTGSRADSAGPRARRAGPSQAQLWRAGLAGLLLGLAILCRPTFAPWAALAGVLCFRLPGSGVRRWTMAGTLLLAVAMVLGGWAWRNQVGLGKPIVATTHGGYTLLLGNNPHFYDYLAKGQRTEPWDARELLEGYRADGHRRATFAPDVPREIQRDRLDYQLAWQAIGRQPAMFARACLERIGRLWSPLPSRTDPHESTFRRATRYLTGAWYTVWLGMAGWGLVRLGPRAARLPWLWGLSLCVVFTGMHAFYWSDLRMRAPLVPVICLLAAWGASRLWIRNRGVAGPIADQQL